VPTPSSDTETDPAARNPRATTKENIMSTQRSTRHPRRLRTRFATGLLALSTAIAIGTSILFLALISAGRTTASTSTTTGANSYAAPAAITSPPPGYFRDPTTHALLRIRTAGNDAPELPGGHNQGRILP